MENEGKLGVLGSIPNAMEKSKLSFAVRVHVLFYEWMGIRTICSSQIRKEPTSLFQT